VLVLFQIHTRAVIAVFCCLLDYFDVFAGIELWFNVYIFVWVYYFGDFLSSFIVFGNWTEQGIKKVVDAPKRIGDTRGMIEKAGGKMQLYYTAGKWDFVMIVEIPKDEDLMAILLCIGSMGNIRTTTMKAWTEAEGAKLLTAPHP
jgi:uncharacterized protein with GYD domain